MSGALVVEQKSKKGNVTTESKTSCGSPEHGIANFLAHNHGLENRSFPNDEFDRAMDQTQQRPKTEIDALGKPKAKKDKNSH